MAVNIILSTLRQTVKLKMSCQIHTQVTPLLFQTSQLLLAEPMKKKKRIDPGIIAAREAKKIRKIDKEIRRLTKFGRILKPVEEIEMDNRKYKLALSRKRQKPKLSYEQLEERALLPKEWGSYQTKMWYQEVHIMERLEAAQEEALNELKLESEDLYKAAIEKDYTTVAIEFQGPKVTPPIKGYTAPDGEYLDTTRKY